MNDDKLILLVKALAQKVDELANDAWIYDASEEEVESVDKLLQAVRDAEEKYGKS